VGQVLGAKGSCRGRVGVEAGPQGCCAGGSEGFSHLALRMGEGAGRVLCEFLCESRKGAHWLLRVSLGSAAARPTAFLGQSVLQSAWLVVPMRLPCTLARASALGRACWLFGRFGPPCNMKRTQMRKLTTHRTHSAD
jgi:hypothetical protein